MDFPSLKEAAFHERELPSTLLLTVPPFCTAVTGMVTLKDTPFHLCVFASIWLFVGSVLKILQAHAKDKKAKQLQSPNRMVGCLHVMHTAILASKGLSPKDVCAREKLRLTIHRLENEEVVQIVDYVGGKPRGGKEVAVGRRRSCRSGVVGRAYTSKDAAHFRRENDDFVAYKREMQTKYAMLPEEAEQLDPERLSHFAVPIGGGNDGRILAIVFLDSDDRDFFSTSIQDLVIAQVIGLAQYAELKYD